MDSLQVSLQYVLPWVLGCICVGVAVGFYLGTTMQGRRKEENDAQQAATLRVLTSLIEASEQMTIDMDVHNTDIQEVGRRLVGLDVDGELQQVQHSLLGEIASVLEANRQLEDDLQYAKLRIEEQAQEIDRTRMEARTDALAGVPNRKAFDEKLRMMVGAWRRQRRPFMLALTDVDHFKWINDTHGHQAGDRVVSNVGRFLRQCIRDGDFVARYGGDEFAILLDNIDEATGLDVAERICAAVAKSNFGVQADSDEAVVTFSIGLCASWDDATPEEALRRADRSLVPSQGRRTKQGRLLSRAGLPGLTASPLSQTHESW